MLATLETDPITKAEIVESNHRRAAAEIMESYHLASDLMSQTMGLARDTCAELIRCGNLCIAKKEEVGHKNWLKWVETYLPQVTERTTQRWMRVANATRMSHLEEPPTSLRQAIELLKNTFVDPVDGQRKRIENQSTPIKPEPSRESCFAPFDRLYAEKVIERLLAKTDFSDWDEVELKLGLRKLEPITETRNRMAYALQVKFGAR